MTINLRQKILVIFLALTFAIIVVTSGVYYYLIVKDIRELSRTQITSAFEMMFDRFMFQVKQTIPQIQSFLDETLSSPMFSIYRTLTQFDETKVRQFQESWDNAGIQQWVLILNYLSRVKHLPDYLMRIVPVLGMYEMVIYDREGNAVALYRKGGEQDMVGIYIPQLRGGTFISLRTEEEIEAVGKWQGVDDIPAAPLPDDILSVYPDDLPRSPRAEISNTNEKVTIKFTNPISRHKEFLGIAVIHIAIPQSDAERFSRFSQTQINLFSETEFSAGMLSEYDEVSFGETDEFHHISLLEGQDIPPPKFSKISIGGKQYYQGRIAFQDGEHGVGMFTANFARQIERDKVKELLTLVAGVGCVLAVLTAIAAFILSARITRPITNISKLLSRMTEGDLEGVITDPAYAEQQAQAKKLRQKGGMSDEIGMLSQTFYSMLKYLREMTEIAEDISLGEMSQTISMRSERDVLGNAFSQMLDYLNEMAAMAAAIAQGDLTVEIALRSGKDSFGQTIRTMRTGLQALIQQIRTSAEEIAATGSTISSLTEQDMELVQHVQGSVTDMVSTMFEMEASVEHVAQNMEMLSVAVEETLSSVSSTSQSMHNIAAKTSNLAQQTQRMITDVNHSVEALEGVAEQTNLSRQFTQETIENALEGQRAVEQVRESMDLIEYSNQNAEDTITRFVHLSQEIGTILDVIQGVTEQSSLLALNASIIAAQAGSHGRGFSVIAEEMRNLANEVAASTKNIGEIVKTLQEETNVVVQMIHDGTAKIGDGVSRTQQAQERLEQIIASVRRSSDVVAKIADALDVQMTTSHNVMDTMKHVNTMTTEITEGTNQQRVWTMQIKDAVEHISELATHTHQATSEQLNGVRRVLEAADNVKMLADQEMESSQRIHNATVADLARQAEILLHSVDRFILS